MTKKQDKISKYFTAKEFLCKCGKCSAMVSPEFLLMLDNAREIADVPFIILSGYRCPEHNAAVGSTSSNHVKGVAADIKAADGPTRGKILRGLYFAGFRRIGINFERGFIHADINDGPESCWSYGG